jgi:hypothetical protein
MNNSVSIPRFPPSRSRVNINGKFVPVADQHFVCFSSILSLFTFHPAPVLPQTPAKNARKILKAQHADECKKLNDEWKAKNEKTNSYFRAAARKEEWGFTETEERISGWYHEKIITTFRYVPFPKLRSWLMEHLPQDAEPSVKKSVEDFDYGNVAAQIAQGWLIAIKEHHEIINGIKRRYDAFVDEVSTPVQQRPWKRQRVEEDKEEKEKI